MVGLLWQYTDRILLGYFIGSAAIAYFSVPQQIIFKILGLVTAASVVLFPRFSIARLDEFSKELYKEFTLISLLFTIVAFSTLSFIIKDFISLWISPSFAAETKNIAIVLAISCMIRGAFPIYEYLFKGIGKPIYNMYIIIASSLIIVILDFMLIPVLGLNGAGIAYLLSPVAGIVAIIFIWLKLLKAPLSEPFRIYLVPLLISYFILAISFLVKRRIYFPPSWLIIILQMVIFLVLQISMLFGYFKLFAPEVLVKLADLKNRTRSIWKPF